MIQSLVVGRSCHAIVEGRSIECCLPDSLMVFVPTAGIGASVFTTGPSPIFLLDFFF